MTARPRPGFATDRLARLARDAVGRMAIDLAGARVLTEAATGAYAVTPVLAALAGAERVDAVTRDSRYGSVAEVAAQTEALADLLGLSTRIRIHGRLEENVVQAADVVTNSGHLRPIDARMVASMKASAVVPLMFEAWEIQAGRFDVDLPALRARGIAYSGTNERHPEVDVFSYLGLMAVSVLVDAGIPPYRAVVALLCDNPFQSYLVDGLSSAGARVTVAREPSDLPAGSDVDAVVVALRPTGTVVLAREEVFVLRQRCGTAPVIQFWGDVDPRALAEAGLACWPPTPPASGHMAVLPSAVGPDPIVRLQAGGLKVASVLLTPPGRRSPSDMEYLDGV